MEKGILKQSILKIKKQYWLLLGMSALVSASSLLVNYLIISILPLSGLEDFETLVRFFLLALVMSLYIGAFFISFADVFIRVARSEDVSFPMLFTGFKTDYGRSVGLYLFMYIKLYLWSLLLVVPGLVMSYAYKMSYFIAVENPHYTAGEAIQESIKMMDGHKGRLFGLHLSLLPFYFPTILFFVFAIIAHTHGNSLTQMLFTALSCICALFVVPLINSVNANFYLMLKDKYVKADGVQPNAIQ